MIIDWKDITPPPKTMVISGNGIFKNGESGGLLCIVSLPAPQRSWINSKNNSILKKNQRDFRDLVKTPHSTPGHLINEKTSVLKG